MADSKLSTFAHKIWLSVCVLAGVGAGLFGLFWLLFAMSEARRPVDQTADVAVGLILGCGSLLIATWGMVWVYRWGLWLFRSDK